MEASATEPSTASHTIADLISRAALEHGEHAAVRYKHDGAWQDVSYKQLADIVEEIALGLIDLGVERGRARLHPCQHASRVVLRRHGDHLGRRRGRADLPDQLARGVPVGDL